MLNPVVKKRANRPYVLSLAGLDPSGGAGLLSDIKTLETHGTIGLGVCTAITAQTEDQFIQTHWISEEEILLQLEPLLDRYAIAGIKIGIIESSETLYNILRAIKEKVPSAYIVWDPVLKPSANKKEVFLELSENEGPPPYFLKVFEIVDCMTPNKEEWDVIQRWIGKTVQDISGTSVYIKSDIVNQDVAIDTLWWRGNRHTLSNPIIKYQKHGSGCVFSSSLIANVSLDIFRNESISWDEHAVLRNSSNKAGRYVHEYLKSSETLLGLHHSIKQTLTAVSKKHVSYEEINKAKRQAQREFPVLQVLTIDSDVRTHREQAEKACQGGANWIQFRTKISSHLEKKQIAEEVQQVCRKYNATFVINDHIELAKEIGADGVHLGQGDMPIEKARAVLGPEVIIGGTANTLDEIQKHIQDDVDYIGIGPYRWTDTKKKLAPILGQDGIAQCHKLFPNVHFTVIGGVVPEDVLELIRLGVKSVAVCSGISLAEEPEKAVQRYLSVF
jgi:thiamine-phosphate pyrophosphorylase